LVIFILDGKFNVLRKLLSTMGANKLMPIQPGKISAAGGFAELGCRASWQGSANTQQSGIL